MARAGDPLTSLLLFLLHFLLAGAVTGFSPSSTEWTPRGSARVPSPMVLPLFLSSANTTRTPISPFRRQLLSSARMRLHDDLLTNGYYTTRLWIGSPPQEFALIVDSGSTVTYVPCSTCEQCGNHQDPRFQPDLSSTYQPVKCNIDCTCDEENVQCTYERQYAEMSSSTGVLGEDIISFGNQSELVPQRAVFGCENAETGDLFSQHADGIMGLGRGQLSIMDQLVEKGVISDSFSLCYGGMDIGGGAMVLGELSPPPEMVFSPSNPVRSPYYNIELMEIHVSGKPLRIKPKVFDSKHGTVLDSGTTYAYLPEEAFLAFKDAIVNNLKLKQIPGPDPNYKDICFSGAGSDVTELSKVFPEVDMVFANGQKMPLSPENYLFRHSKIHDAYCLGIFSSGRDPTTLLGGIVVRNTLVIYDRQKERIGFWKTNCSELWERLQIHGVHAPAPSASYNGETTIEISPAPSPEGLQNYILSGQFEVGLITFDMSLTVKYPDLKPHIPELAELIAHELEIDANQVRLMNFTSIANETLIRCVILPLGSNFISNTAAVGIISRLTEHRVRLPENFGNYKLVEWNVEPPSRRSWWHQHLLGVVSGIVAIVILGFSTLAAWYFWKWKHGDLTTYRHVDAATPEQELTPL